MLSYRSNQRRAHTRSIPPDPSDIGSRGCSAIRQEIVSALTCGDQWWTTVQSAGRSGRMRGRIGYEGSTSFNHAFKRLPSSASLRARVRRLTKNLHHVFSFRLAVGKQLLHLRLNRRAQCSRFRTPLRRCSIAVGSEDAEQLRIGGTTMCLRSATSLSVAAKPVALCRTSGGVSSIMFRP